MDFGERYIPTPEQETDKKQTDHVEIRTSNPMEVVPMRTVRTYVCARSHAHVDSADTRKASPCNDQETQF